MSSLYQRTMGVRPSQEIIVTAVPGEALRQLEHALVSQGFRVTESRESSFLAEYGNRLSPALFDFLSVFPGRVGKLGKFARVLVTALSTNTGCVLRSELEAAYIVSDAAEPMLRALHTAVAGFAERGELVSSGPVTTKPLH